MHAFTPSTLSIELACGARATLQTTMADGLELVSFQAGPRTRPGLTPPPLPAPIIGFGPLWTWDANRADQRELPANTVSRYESEHLYKLGEGYFFVNEPGKGYPGFGPIAAIHWQPSAIASH